MEYHLEIHSSEPLLYTYNWRTVKFNTDAGLKNFGII